MAYFEDKVAKDLTQLDGPSDHIVRKTPHCVQMSSSDKDLRFVRNDLQNL